MLRPINPLRDAASGCGPNSVTLHTPSQENIWEGSHFAAEASPVRVMPMSNACVESLSPEQVALAVWAIRQAGEGTPQERLEAVLGRLRHTAREMQPAQR